jgi:regulatory protein
MAFGVLSVKGRALRYLAQREHSRAELERKLAQHVEDLPDASARQQIADALDELTARGFICEARVAESVLAAKSARFGVHRLRQTLQSKGLAPELITTTLQAAQASEFERALGLWQRRFGQAPADAKDHARQMRFLAGRGFAGDVIRSVLRPPKDD